MQSSLRKLLDTPCWAITLAISSIAVFILIAVSISLRDVMGNAYWALKR